MEPGSELPTRSPLVAIAVAVVTVGLVRAAGRLLGLAVLLGVVIACVAAFAIGIPVLRLLILH